MPRLRPNPPGREVRDDGVRYIVRNSAGEPMLHRDDGPAHIRFHPRGSAYWWFHGKLHRTDGPAVEHPRGSKLWFIHGQYIPPSEIERLGPDAAVMKALIRSKDNA